MQSSGEREVQGQQNQAAHNWPPVVLPPYYWQPNPYGQQIPNLYGQHTPNLLYGQQPPNLLYGQQPPNLLYGQQPPSLFGHAGPSPGTDTLNPTSPNVNDVNQGSGQNVASPLPIWSLNQRWNPFTPWNPWASTVPVGPQYQSTTSWTSTVPSSPAVRPSSTWASTVQSDPSIQPSSPPNTSLPTTSMPPNPPVCTPSRSSARIVRTEAFAADDEDELDFEPPKKRKARRKTVAAAFDSALSCRTTKPSKFERTFVKKMYENVDEIPKNGSAVDFETILLDFPYGSLANHRQKIQRKLNIPGSFTLYVRNARSVRKIQGETADLVVVTRSTPIFIVVESEVQLHSPDVHNSAIPSTTTDRSKTRLDLAKQTLEEEIGRIVEIDVQPTTKQSSLTSLTFDCLDRRVSEAHYLGKSDAFAETHLVKIVEGREMDSFLRGLKKVPKGEPIEIKILGCEATGNGVAREVLRKVMDQLAEKTMIGGCILQNNTNLKNGYYRALGKTAGIAIKQFALSFDRLSKVQTLYLLEGYEAVTSLTPLDLVNEVPQEDEKEWLEKVLMQDIDYDADVFLGKYNFLAENATSACTAAAVELIVGKNGVAIAEFAEGLAEFGIIEDMAKDRYLASCVVWVDMPMSAKDFKSSYVPLMSESGSNRYTDEAERLMLFDELLDEIENGDRPDLTMKCLARFITSTNYVGEHKKITIAFKDTAVVQASTCTSTLFIPTQLPLRELKDKICFQIMNSMGFGSG